MVKIHQNAEKFPIQWNGNIVGGESEGDNIPSDITLVWGATDVTWETPNSFKKLWMVLEVVQEEKDKID